MYTKIDYNRRSLNNALFKGDFSRAFQKVNENIQIIDENIKQIKNYSLLIGSKQDKKETSEENNELIESTAQLLVDTFNYISDIKDYQYVSNTERIENVNKAKSIEKTVVQRKNNFQTLVEQIKKQGEQYISNTRNSLKLIEEDDSQRKSNDNENISKEINNQTKYLEAEYRESIEEKGNQIERIENVLENLNELSKQTTEVVLQSGEKIDSIEDNVNQMNSNIANAVNHMKEAKKYNESAGGYSNYCLYGIGFIVLLLIFLVLIMPKS